MSNLWDTTPESIGMPVRVQNTLERMGLMTWEDVRDTPDSEFRALPNVGAVTLRLIRVSQSQHFYGSEIAEAKALLRKALKLLESVDAS